MVKANKRKQLIIHLSLLKTEGFVVNKKRTYRIYAEEGLQVRIKKRKKLTRPRQPLERPTSVNQRWSVDFLSDQLAGGRRFRVLNVVDDHSHRWLDRSSLYRSADVRYPAFYLDSLSNATIRRRSSLTTVQSLRAKPCSSGAKKLQCSLALFNQANELRMLSLRA